MRWLFFFLCLAAIALPLQADRFIIACDGLKPPPAAGGCELQPLFPGSLAPLSGLYVLTCAPGRPLSALKQAFPSATAIAPERFYRFQAEPDDPRLPSQPGLALCRFFSAWDRNTGSDAVVMAVVDSGVDYGHPDLAGRIWHNPGEIPDNGLDDDGNGYIDDTIGWDFVSASADAVYPGEDPGPEDNDPSDFSGHGTHVSGIMAAATNNGFGMAGATWQGRVMCLRAGYVTSDGLGYLSDIDAARAIIYAAANGAHIINLSWGDIVPSLALEKAISFALSQDCLVVSAAGNSAEQGLLFPAAMPGVVAVGSVTDSGELSSFSNRDRDMDVLAPGENVLSLAPGGGFQHITGTSMSCALVSGALGLLKSHFPSACANLLRGRLLTTASGIGGYADMPHTGCLDMVRAFTTPALPYIVLDASTFQGLPWHSSGVTPGSRSRMTVRLKNLFAPSRDLSLQLLSRDPLVHIAGDWARLPGIGCFATAETSDQPFIIDFDSGFYPGRRTRFSLDVAPAAGAWSTRLFMDFVMPYPENDGFPLRLAGAVVTSPLVADINNDGCVEILFAGYDGIFYAYSGQGGLLPQYRRLSKAPVSAAPAIADLDQDGGLEIVFAGHDGRLQAIDSSGADLPGFPLTLPGPVYGSTALADIDQDGYPDIVVASLAGTLHVRDRHGASLPGFPRSIPPASYASPCVADMSPLPGLEIIIGGADGKVYAFHGNGQQVAGFPIATGSYVFSSPACADLDQDGVLEIVFASYDGKLYLVDADGNAEPGFPLDLGAATFSSPCLQDMDGNGSLDIVIGSGTPADTLYAFDRYGGLLPGFPFHAGAAVASSPCACVLADGRRLLAAGSYSGEIITLYGNGEPVAGFPYPVSADILCSPTLADADQDGDMDLLFGDNNGVFHVIDLPVCGNNSPAWSTFRGNYRRTGTVYPAWPAESNN